jgi:ABC-type nitrate/sulfonate/bicarbonate transport system substrate-binding protein
MKYSCKALISIFLVAGTLLSACEAKLAAPLAAAASPAASTAPAASPWTIYAPESTSSIPVILAVKNLPNFKVVLYNDQSQANALLLRGDASILITGLSVGVDLYAHQAPVRVINSYVTGLSYLVTYGKKVSSFKDLKGQDLYLPFEGSPLEEISSYLTAKDGLVWKVDVHPVYSPFDASVSLLKQGKVTAVVLPEPVVSTLAGQPNVYVSLSLYDLWNQYNPGAQGYPQVVSLVNSQWAADHSAEITQFDQALSAGIQSVGKDPASAVETAKGYFKFPAAILIKSLSRTHYQLTTGKEMQQSIENYYQVIGKPIDEKDSGFYYLAEK